MLGCGWCRRAPRPGRARLSGPLQAPSSGPRDPGPGVPAPARVFGPFPEGPPGTLLLRRAREVPGEHIVITRGRERFYYGGGIWSAPRGPGFLVVAPPIGVFVPILPPFYTTVWIGGIPYYYANDAYYVWRDSAHGYEVVEPPEDRNATTQAPESDEIFIYPKNGQSEDQQARDKYECHRWAASQTGFDPTQSGGGVPPEHNSSKRAEYQRAMGACLEGRGYSVK